ncbi:MAG: c-type cytochrome [Betaproteobacteria bacterium]|nr:c-type cytochrome [Betaproteobacteria bacterium]
MLSVALLACACGGGSSSGTAAGDTAAVTTDGLKGGSVPTPAPAPTPVSAPAPTTAPVPAPPPPAPAPAPAASTATPLSVGALLFREKSLSASGQLACASCHDEASAHADPAGTTLPLGGVSMSVQGFRSSPSLRYLEDNTAFRFGGNGAPRGGFTWDGRADTRAAQAAGPLLAVNEMANADIAAVAARVRSLGYFSDFARVFGLAAGAGDQAVYDTLRTALQTYQQLDPDYQRFNSRFDQFLDGKIALSAQEQRGLAVFNDPARGNCSSCHSSQTGGDGSRPLFTNFGYFALGVPRNPAITANADPAFFDMGLCGPKRTDLSARTDLCGFFKVPTLRNAALTAPYFHNGAVARLEDVVRFYATRDSNPAWYPAVAPGVLPYNDLPPTLRGNVHQGAPFNRGRAPRISPQDADDLVAFLRTLTDDPTLPPASRFVGR